MCVIVEAIPSYGLWVDRLHNYDTAYLPQVIAVSITLSNLQEFVSKREIFRNQQIILQTLIQSRLGCLLKRVGGVLAPMCTFFNQVKGWRVHCKPHRVQPQISDNSKESNALESLDQLCRMVLGNWQLWDLKDPDIPAANSGVMCNVKLHSRSQWWWHVLILIGYCEFQHYLYCA